MNKISHEQSSGDVFADMGFSPEETEELNVKSSLITAIHDTITTRKLTQKVAAQICGTERMTAGRSEPRGPDRSRGLPGGGLNQTTILLFDRNGHPAVPT